MKPVRKAQELVNGKTLMIIRLIIYISNDGNNTEHQC